MCCTIRTVGTDLHLRMLIFLLIIHTHAFGFVAIFPCAQNVSHHVGFLHQWCVAHAVFLHSITRKSQTLCLHTWNVDGLSLSSSCFVSVPTVGLVLLLLVLSLTICCCLIRKQSCRLSVIFRANVVLLLGLTQSIEKKPSFCTRNPKKKKNILFHTKSMKQTDQRSNNSFRYHGFIGKMYKATTRFVASNAIHEAFTRLVLTQIDFRDPVLNHTQVITKENLLCPKHW